MMCKIKYKTINSQSLFYKMCLFFLLKSLYAPQLLFHSAYVHCLCKENFFKGIFEFLITCQPSKCLDITKGSLIELHFSAHFLRSKALARWKRV